MKRHAIMSGRLLFIGILSFFIIAASFGCAPREKLPPLSTPATETVVPPTTQVPSETPVPAPEPSPVAALPLTPEPTVPSTPNTKQELLTIFSVSVGDVSVLRAGAGAWIPATSGMTLQPGDTIKSGDGSQAEITLFDGSIVEVFPDTEIKISELSVSGTGATTIRMQQQIGKTLSRVKKLTDSASRYEIETPAAVAAVRGSVMTLTVAGDGTTVVTNEEGDIRVTAQGVEVIIPEGSKSSVAPGEAPGQPEPKETPPTPTPTPTVTPDYGSPAPVYLATISTGVQPDRSEAYIGETITYNYHISNTGNLQLRDVLVSDNITGVPAYQGGDNNADTRLDPGETWTFTATHIASIDDPSPLGNTVTFSVMVGTSYQLTAIDHAEVYILSDELTVEITSPEDGATLNTRTIEVSGTVSDASITEGTITINEDSHAIAISEGSFSTSENVNDGENTITVSVTGSEEQTASDTITIHVETTSYGIRIELTWDTDGTDVDAHLIRPGSVIFDEDDGDCYYGNPNPEWGEEGDQDNPSLDQDDQDGYGPENITLEQPYEGGVYQYKVHYFDDNDEDGYVPTTATVRIWINDIKMAEYSKLLGEYEIWDCAFIEWPSGIILVPAISLVKTADVAVAVAGDNITYIFEVTNAGNVPLANILVTDNMSMAITFVSGDTNGNEILDVSENWTFTAAYVVNIDDTYTLENTATASGRYMVTEQEVTAEDRVSVTINEPSPAIAISKTADVSEAVAGDNITYIFEVTNAGNVPLADISVTDEMFETVELVSGDTNGNGILEVSENWTFTAAYVVNIDDTYTLENTATASGRYMVTEQEVTAEDRVSVTINNTP